MNKLAYTIRSTERRTEYDLNEIRRIANHIIARMHSVLIEAESGSEMARFNALGEVQQSGPDLDRAIARFMLRKEHLEDLREIHEGKLDAK